jgi:hypothetical protein
MNDRKKIKGLKSLSFTLPRSLQGENPGIAENPPLKKGKRGKIQ